MDTPASQDPTTNAAAEAGSVPNLWRKNEPASLPNQPPAATPRRRVFLWLLAFLALGAALISVLAWMRPIPRPYFAPLWISDYQFRPFHSPPFSKQDQQALTEGNYFAQGRIQLR